MSEDLKYTLLQSRGVIRLSGADLRPYLQALISNDVARLAHDRAIYAALLTPQGKYLHDFFLAEAGGEFLLDGELARLEDLGRRLTMYRLRAQVEIEDGRDSHGVAALMGEAAAAAFGIADEAGRAVEIDGCAVFVDPRHRDAGLRAVGPGDALAALLARHGARPVPFEDYDRHRLALGLPDGSRDLVVEKSTLLESGFEELNGVDFLKGCFVGQELTARTKYRGLVKKRLLPVEVRGPMPAPGTEILLDGKNAGEMRSGRDGRALALLRLEKLDAAEAAGHELAAGEARIRPRRPDWLAL